MILSYDAWLKLQPKINLKIFNDKITEVYNTYKENTYKVQNHVKETGGFPFCHCNNCIEDIDVYKGFKKYSMYNYKGYDVYISSFCPLENCKEIFIQGIDNAICEWLSYQEAQKYLQPIIEGK